jgi:pimeloyl-ACP methyl ester carboxylesterase
MALMRAPLLLQIAASTALALGSVSDSRSQEARAAARAVPFAVEIPEPVLADLRQRLERTRWPDQLPGTGWEYGADTAYLKELADYWQNDFDWRAQEARINAFDHFRAQIDGQRIHFIHERSSDPDAIPLLLLHGWPSSFVQMLDIIPLLTNPAAHGLGEAPSFHVVAASLPGFGFSDVPTRPGVGFATSAALMAALMTEVLGYERYGVRGSDLGGVIVQQIALAHPEQVIGVHLTGIIGAAGGQPPFTSAEQAFVDASRAMETELAYARVHMSRPQTLAHALTDSPVGLAAWIAEKFRSWGDTNGDIESRFSKDELLTNLTTYWVTGTANSSIRIYYEFIREPMKTGRIEAPVGMLMSHKDLFPPAPREWGERLFNIVHWTDTHTGGHFLEWEEPALVARDLQEFFGPLRR